jgi:hypothetical protein
LGLIAAPFSEQVVATDRNERAAMIARFNALLNGIDHVEVRVGDLFDPVAGERFDLVVSNPPFVITPHQRLMFRDGGVRGDEFCQNLIREVPGYLEDGGFCQMLGNFAHRTNRRWRDDLGGWFADLGCDVLVLITRQQSIEDYAMSWITTTESQDVTVVPKMFDEWMEFYEREQIERISFVHVTMRRGGSGTNWTHVDEKELKIVGECGDLIRRRFEILDFLAALAGDEALLDERVMLAPQVRLVQEHVMTGEGPRVAANQLEMRGGFRHAVQLDVNLTRLLVYCDGQQPLRNLLGDIAQSLDADLDRIVQIALPAVRHLLERGILIPIKLLSKGHAVLP